MTSRSGAQADQPLGPNGQAVLVILELDTEFMAVGNIPAMLDIFETMDAVRKEADFPRGLELG